MGRNRADPVRRPGSRHARSCMHHRRLIYLRIRCPLQGRVGPARSRILPARRPRRHPGRPHRRVWRTGAAPTPPPCRTPPADLPSLISAPRRCRLAGLGSSPPVPGPRRPRGADLAGLRFPAAHCPAPRPPMSRPALKEAKGGAPSARVGSSSSRSSGPPPGRQGLGGCVRVPNRERVVGPGGNPTASPSPAPHPSETRERRTTPKKRPPLEGRAVGKGELSKHQRDLLLSPTLPTPLKTLEGAGL